MKKIFIARLFLSLMLISVLFVSGCSLKKTAEPSKLRQTGAPINNVSEIAQVDISVPRLVDKSSFSIEAPAYWKESPALTPGVSLLMVNALEKMERPEVQKINFRSYFSISYGTLDGKTLDDYVVALKEKLVQMVPNMIFQDEALKNKVFIDGREAKVFSADFTQQGVDFKFLMYVAPGKDNDVWMISLNSLPENFEEYRGIFNTSALSFRVK